MALPSPLEVVVKLARARSDDAAVALGRAIGASRSSEERLALLETYRAEYLTRLADAGSRGLQALELANFHAFLAKLDAAIAQQVTEVRSHSHAVGAQRERWIDEKRRLEGFLTLEARRASAAQRTEARREQRATDEAAARCALRRKG
jgi:flagellar FliJ protein